MDQQPILVSAWAARKLREAGYLKEDFEAAAEAEDLAYDIFYAKSIPADARTLDECIADEYEQGLF